MEKPATSEITIPALVDTIKAHLAKGAQSKEKSDQHYITAGLRLKELKARKPGETPWPEYVRKTFDLGQSRADQLIRIADGRTTIEKERADQSVRDERNRQARRLSSDDNADSQDDDAEQIADAGSPADAVKAAADRSVAKTPKPVPDVAPAADRAEPNVIAKATKPEEIRIEQMVESVARTPAKFREAMNQIASAETTPAAFWAEAARELPFWDHANVAAVTLLDSAILKLAAIKAGQPEAAASESSS
jgi:hypothetical protein